MQDISAVMIVKDGAKSIQKSLESLEDFSEIIVFDNGSTDQTKEIAQTFSNVKLVEGEFDGFGPTKNSAASFSTNPWIFSIDSDEVVSKTLLNSLKVLKKDNKNIYSILRKNFYKQQEIKHCWGKDTLVRLYHKNETKFNSNHLHEDVVSAGLETIRISGSLYHYPYNSISDFIKKFDHFSTVYAQDMKGKKNPSPVYALVNGLFSFLKTYFLKRAFLDGYPGLLIAFSHGATNFYKYMKLYERNIEKE